MLVSILVRVLVKLLSVIQLIPGCLSGNDVPRPHLGRGINCFVVFKALKQCPPLSPIEFPLWETLTAWLFPHLQAAPQSP